MFQIKKLAVSFVVALGIVGFANADSIKCDSKDAKVAFAQARCDITAGAANELKSKGKFEDEYDPVWFEGNKLVCEHGEEGVDYEYTNFKTLKNNSCSCSMKARIMKAFGGGDLESSEITFTLKNTKKGLVAKIISY